MAKVPQAGTKFHHSSFIFGLNYNTTAVLDDPFWFGKRNIHLTHSSTCAVGLLDTSGQTDTLDLYKDSAFADFRTTLDAEMKRLQHKGIGSIVRQAEALSEDDVRNIALRTHILYCVHNHALLIGYVTLYHLLFTHVILSLYLVRDLLVPSARDL